MGAGGAGGRARLWAVLLAVANVGAMVAGTVPASAQVAVDPAVTGGPAARRGGTAMSALVFTRDRAPVGKWGVLRLLDHRHLVLESGGRAETFDAELEFPAHVGPTGWLFEDRGRCILTWPGSERVLVIDLSVPEVSDEWRIQRDPDRGLRRLELRPGGSASVVALWERGLASIGPSGTPEWVAMHEDRTAGIADITDESVWIKGRSGDVARDRRRGYRLSDGTPLGSAG